MSTDPLADDVRDATKDQTAMSNLTERFGYRLIVRSSGRLSAGRFNR